MTAFFVAGTDTGIGKTTVTGLLAKALSKKGVGVITQKWVQCGDLHQLDLHRHDFLSGAQKQTLDPLRGPYTFQAPVSPHLAARMEGKSLNLARIKMALSALEARYEMVLVEGAGGLEVPVNETETLLDWVETLGLPVILVSENRVGTLNHTLLSLRDLSERKIPLVGLILNQVQEKVVPEALADNKRFLAKKAPILANLPYKKEEASLEGFLDSAAVALLSWESANVQ